MWQDVVMFEKEQVIQRIREKHSIPHHIQFDVSDLENDCRDLSARYTHSGRTVNAVWRRSGGQLQTCGGWFKVNGCKLEKAIERFMMHANDSHRFYDR